MYISALCKFKFSGISHRICHFSAYGASINLSVYIAGNEDRHSLDQVRILSGLDPSTMTYVPLSEMAKQYLLTYRLTEKA